MKKYTIIELSDILQQHQLWLNDNGGSCANLKNANLEGANLKNANLESAGLENANLEKAGLENANLKYSNLKDANLVGANLESADLRCASLEGANLEYSNLVSANLKWANLVGADLDYSCLPLWCGSLKFKTDERILSQIAYHLASLLQYNGIDLTDFNLVKYANKTHVIKKYNLEPIGEK